jgi:hypothetical protein
MDYGFRSAIASLARTAGAAPRGDRHCGCDKGIMFSSTIEPTFLIAAWT